MNQLVDLLVKVISPTDTMKDYMSAKDLRDLEMGIVSRTTLYTFWEGYGEDVKVVMLDVLCQFDLLIRLRGNTESGDDDIFAIPALLPRTKEFQWSSVPGEVELCVITEFDKSMPIGLRGRIITNLHNKFSAAQRDARFIRPDAAIIVTKEGGRVFLEFLDAERKLVWRFRSRSPVITTKLCLQGFNNFMNEPFRKVNMKHSHSIFHDCCVSLQGCQGKGTIRIRLDSKWIEDQKGNQFPSAICHCEACERPWRTEESTKVLFQTSQAFPNSGLSHNISINYRPFDAFVSHAGPDKFCLAQPLQQALEQINIHTFLDVEHLQISNDKAPPLMERALAESNIGIFILSPEFAARQWPIIELQHFLKRNRENIGNSRPVLLPVFYRLEVAECEHVYEEDSPHYQLIADAGFFSEWRQSRCSTNEAKLAMREIREFSGVETKRLAGGERLSTAAIVQEVVSRISQLGI